MPWAREPAGSAHRPENRRAESTHNLQYRNKETEKHRRKVKEIEAHFLLP